MSQTNTETGTGCQRLAVLWTRECSPGPVANWLPPWSQLEYRSPPYHCNNDAPNTLTQNTSNYEIIVSNESVDDQELFEALMMTRTNRHWLSKAAVPWTHSGNAALDRLLTDCPLDPYWCTGPQQECSPFDLQLSLLNWTKEASQAPSIGMTQFLVPVVQNQCLKVENAWPWHECCCFVPSSDMTNSTRLVFMAKVVDCF